MFGVPLILYKLKVLTFSENSHKTQHKQQILKQKGTFQYTSLLNHIRITLIQWTQSRIYRRNYHVSMHWNMSHTTMLFTKDVSEEGVTMTPIDGMSQTKSGIHLEKTRGRPCVCGSRALLALSLRQSGEDWRSAVLRCSHTGSQARTEDGFPTQTGADRDGNTSLPRRQRRRVVYGVRNYTGIRNKRLLDGSSSAPYTVSEIVVTPRQREKLGLISVISPTLPFLLRWRFYRRSAAGWISQNCRVLRRIPF